MPDAGKISVSVHQIDINKFEENSFDSIIDQLVSLVNKNDIKLKKEPVKRKTIDDSQIRVYSSYSKHPPKWRSFLEPILNKNSKLTTCENRTFSYVCFIGLGEYIFAIAGGIGSLAIGRFTVQTFGLDIIVRLFTKDSKVIKAIQDRGLTGSILGQTKFYRGDQRFSDEDQFGKIFREVKAELNKRLLTKTFGFAETDLKKKVSGCLAKSSFQINKSVDFVTLLLLNKRFVEILKQKEKFSLNKVTLISRRNKQNDKLLLELNEWLVDQLYTNCKKESDSDVDVCHKEFERYLTASDFCVPLEEGKPIQFDRPFTFQELIIALKKMGAYIDDDIHLFRHSVLLRQLKTLDDDGELLTTGLVIEHIQAEIVYQDKTYFFVDNEWYQIQPSFIKDLNSECENLLNQAWDEKLITEPFDTKKRESEFNLKFINREGFLVFDTVTPDNIEACDILQFDDENLHLVHVKKGFNNSIRDLASQITISAKRIRDDIKTGYEYIDKLESQTRALSKSVNPQLQKLGNQMFPTKGLASIFKTKKNQYITFCLAFVDISNDNRFLKTDLKRFQSNIAKFSLLELQKSIISMGFGFKVIQLVKC